MRRATVDPRVQQQVDGMSRKTLRKLARTGGVRQLANELNTVAKVAEDAAAIQMRQADEAMAENRRRSDEQMLLDADVKFQMLLDADVKFEEGLPLQQCDLAAEAAAGRVSMPATGIHAEGCVLPACGQADEIMAEKRRRSNERLSDTSMCSALLLDVFHDVKFEEGWFPQQNFELVANHHVKDGPTISNEVGEEHVQGRTFTAQNQRVCSGMPGAGLQSRNQN
eukprot:SAG31_NODE_1937_length_6866_cov_3.173932_2_plen_224_part_00